MEAEELILHDCSERQVIKQLSEALPDIGVAVFAGALIIEAIDLSDLSGLMIASEDGDSIFVPDLECDEQGDSFYGVVSCIKNSIPRST